MSGPVQVSLLGQGALDGIGQLLGAQDPAEPAPATAAAPKPVSDAAPPETKKGKKRQAAAEPGPAPEQAAKQFLQNFLGN